MKTLIESKLSVPALPKGVIEADLKRPAVFTECEGIPYEDRQFDLWYTTGFGWCIPTLLISKGRRHNTTDRTYAITVNKQQSVRIGHGPHVTRTVTVHTRKTTLARLQPFLDLRRSGQANAGSIRDRISSRRAAGQEFRAEGRTSWNWSEKL